MKVFYTETSNFSFYAKRNKIFDIQQKIKVIRYRKISDYSV